MRTIPIPLCIALFIVFVFATGVQALISEGGLGIVYGQDHAFSVKAPKGWMLDNESGVQQGVHAAFYPKGGTWDESTIIAYARSRPRTDKVSTAEEAANFVVKDFQENGNPKYAVKFIKKLKTAAGKEAAIYHFTGDQWGNSEAVAYFVEEKTINFVVLNSRDPKVFASSLEAFDALVTSYLYLGDHPLEDADEGKKAGKKK